MPVHPRGLVAVALTACAAHTPPTPELEPARPAAVPDAPLIGGTGSAWQVALTEDVVGLVDDKFYVWDRDASGIAERSAKDGAALRTLPIAGLNINGAPRYWEAVPGGFLAQWDGPAFIRDTGGALSVGWIDRSSDWYADHLRIGDTMIAVANRDRAALVRLAWADGREQWRTPLPAWLGLEDLTTDGSHVHVAMQVYDANSPTPRVAVPMRVAAFDLATGAPAWSHDFAVAPGAVAAAAGTLVAAIGGDLQFIDGATGRVRTTVSMGRPHIYPRLLLADGRVLVALNGTTSAVTSFDLATGAKQWSTALALGGGPELARAGDLVLVTTAVDGVAALALADGAPQWEIGLGVDGHRLWASPSAVVFATYRLAGGFRLPCDIPEEQATFHGRVLAVRCGELSDAVVQVGGTDVKPDADGNYRATIRARGFVVVGAVGTHRMPRRDTPSDAVGRVSVRLDGRGDYTVPDLTLDRCESE